MIESLQRSVNVLVIGGGPSGLAIVATLINNTKLQVCWIDEHFTAGRLSKFPAVPSNTKTRLFVRYAEECAVPFAGEWKLRNLPQEDGCPLELAAEMVRELTVSMRDQHRGRLICKVGRCNELRTLGSGWRVTLTDGDAFLTEKVILATGSHPKCGPKLVKFSGKIIDPEMFLSSPPSIPIRDSDVIGVVGSSHTAILILKNLSELPIDQRPKIINFYQSPLRFAEYLPDGRIKYDNTGLKGEAAMWARKNILDCSTGSSEIICCDGLINRVHLEADTEMALHDEFLPKCTKLVWAIGYVRNELPIIQCENDDDKPLKVEGYNDQGQLFTPNSIIIPNLYGMGIAFPERVIDPSGGQEDAVGLWKFMCSAKKLISSW